MDLEKLTIGEAREIAALFGAKSTVRREYGNAILVADRGFVYVGDVTVNGDFAEIKNARNLRYWGTKNGLGELVLNGPLENTKLDPCGDLDVPMRAVISIHRSEKKLWEK